MTMKQDQDTPETTPKQTKTVVPDQQIQMQQYLFGQSGIK